MKYKKEQRICPKCENLKSTNRNFCQSCYKDRIHLFFMYFLSFTVISGLLFSFIIIPFMYKDKMYISLTIIIILIIYTPLIYAIGVKTQNYLVRKYYK